MNVTYYYEVQKKHQISDRNLDETVEEESEARNFLHNETRLATTFGGEHFINDYEIMNNDEFDEDSDELIDLTLRNVSDKMKISNFGAVCGESSKLQLNLNAAKISLKSSPTKINKSIPTETEIERRTKECKKAQHVPSPFTIEPLRRQNKRALSRSDDNESNSLPEIVLPSFEMRENAAAMRHTMRKSATTTFQTKATSSSSTLLSCVKTHIENSPAETSNREQLQRSIVKIPIPPPPPPPSTQHPSSTIAKFSNKPNTTTTIAEVHADRIRRDSDDGSEINSQQSGGISSTSPESLMDTILSAASSVSVCDNSTNSSNSTATDIARFGINIDVDKTPTHTIEELEIPRLAADIDVNVNMLPARITKPKAALNEASYTSYRNEKMLLNGSLNSKSNRVAPLPTSLNATLSTTMPSTTTTRKAPPATPAVRISDSSSLLQPPQYNKDTASTLRSRSPSPSPSLRIIPERALYPDDLKCQICAEPFNDPRTLNCLHSFCFQCLVNENFSQDQSIPFWSQPNEANPATAAVVANEQSEWKTSVKSNPSLGSESPDMTIRSFSESNYSPSKQRRASFSFRRKKSQDRIQLKAKSDIRCSEKSSSMGCSPSAIETAKKLEDDNDRTRFIFCKTCNFPTELPLGGLRQLPHNLILTRKIEEIKLKAGDEIISHVFCTLCFEETNATYHCVTCTLNLCTLCKSAHERQRTTANHTIRNIMDLRRARKTQQIIVDGLKKFTLKCGMHPGFEVKSFCTVCLQVACADCLVLLHKGHKHETISKAIGNYSKILNNSMEQTRPFCNYADTAVERLSTIAKDINRKCDEIQNSVETFMQQYFEALEAHRKTLLQQVNRARESKTEILLEQQLEMEKRSSETLTAVRFCQELRELASDVEVLSFVNILLKRFEYCRQFKMPIDPKISDSLHFLPKIVAPSTKEQNDITLFGIITMQTVEPTLCTLQIESFSHLRLHKRVELLILTRDVDNLPLCHGGILGQIQVHLKYKESIGKDLPFELSDNRDGTYCIAFTPDAQGTLLLTISINEKPIKGSPFTFPARSVRPHSGIYHCCSFCSSGRNKGTKSVRCSCEGRMQGYNGCGHGHAGHPGRRHWSCCGNVLENSECNVSNKLLNSE